MNRKYSLFRDIARNRGLLLLAGPGLIFLLAFNYLPMIGIIIPFKDIHYEKGIFGSDWAGLDNFQYLFSSDNILQITRNTVVWNLVFIALTLVVSLSFALMLYNLGRRKVKVYQTALFIPYFLPWVVVSYVVYAFLNPEMGVLNQLCRSLGIQEVNWYAEPGYWPCILALSYLWKNAGYYTILFYTALLGLDSSYFEAAEMDGAGRLQVVMSVSIPLIAPVIALLTMLQLGRIFFADFGLFYFIPKDSGALYSVTDVIDTYVFRALRLNSDIGMAAASGLYQTIAGFILVLFTNKIIKRVNEDLAIF